LSANNFEASERSLLLIEKEVVTQAILWKLAEDTNGIGEVLLNNSVITDPQYYVKHSVKF